MEFFKRFSAFEHVLPLCGPHNPAVVAYDRPQQWGGLNSRQGSDGHSDVFHYCHRMIWVHSWYRVVLLKKEASVQGQRSAMMSSPIQWHDVSDSKIQRLGLLSSALNICWTERKISALQNQTLTQWFLLFIYPRTGFIWKNLFKSNAC